MATATVSARTFSPQEQFTGQPAPFPAPKANPESASALAASSHLNSTATQTARADLNGSARGKRALQMKISSAKEPKTSLVAARSNSTQEKSTRKQASSITPKAEESRKQGVGAIVDIIEHVSLYAPETPLTPSQVSELYDASESHAKYACVLSEFPSKDHDYYFATRLEDMRACLAAAKSGKFSLPPREMKRMAGVFAAHLFQEIRERADSLIEAGQAALEKAV